MNDKLISLRSAELADLAWLDPLHESLMRPYYEELNKEWDTTVFRKCFDVKESTVIQYGELDVGLLKVREREDGFYLADIFVKPEYQGRGIGAAVMQDLLKIEHRQGRDVRLRVLKGNPAIELYRRFGFDVEEELNDCYLMLFSD